MLLGGLSHVYISLQSTVGLLAVHIIHEGLPASTQLQLCKDYAKNLCKGIKSGHTSLT